MAMATQTPTWTLSSLIGAFIDLSLAYLLLCGAALAFAASTFLSFFGLSLPLPVDGLYSHPTATIASVHSSLRPSSPLTSVLCPDSPQFTEDSSGLRQRRKSLPPAELSGSVSGAEDAGLRGSGRTQSLGNEGMLIRDLEQALEEEQAARAALYLDLEKERSAAATAADEAMAMILRLQEEKAAVKMEARQYRRMVEEKSLYDAEEMGILKEIVLRREMDKHFLEKELEGYRLHGGKEEMEIGIQQVEEKLLEADLQLRGSDDESEDPVLVLYQIYESLGKMKSKGIKKQPLDDTWSPTSGAQVHAAVDFGKEGIAEDTITSNHGDIKQAYRFENHPLDKSDSGCESPLEFQEKGVVPSSDQRQGTSYGESSHKAASVLLKEQDDAKDAGQKVSDSSQIEAELRVLDVYAIEDRLNLADGGNDKDADLSRMRCGNDIYGKVGPVVESVGTDTIGVTYINPVSDSGSVEQNISRSSSDMTSTPRLMGTLSHKPSPFNLRRSSMSVINNERSRLEIEVELLRKRLESVQQGRERLSLIREHKEDESFQLHLLEEMACQLQEMRKTTEPERNVHQALLPPLSSKVVSKKRSSHSVSWGLQDGT